MPKYNGDRCMLCGGCESVCDVNAIMLTPLFLEYNPRRCMECRKCVEICPSGAWCEIQNENAN